MGGVSGAVQIDECDCELVIDVLREDAVGGICIAIVPELFGSI